jgi:hypothetical protein
MRYNLDVPAATGRGDLDMRMPSHSALCSFVFSLILTSALIPSNGDVSLAAVGAPGAQMAVQSMLNGLRAEGFSAGSELALPPSVPAPSAAPAAAVPTPASPLTPELLGKMMKVLALTGKDHAVPAYIANPLGLTATGQNWPDRQIMITEDVNDPAAFRHGIASSLGSDLDLALAQSRPEAQVSYFFRIHRDGTLVTVVAVDKKTGAITMRAPAEAQADMNLEIAFWTAHIDELIPAK